MSKYVYKVISTPYDADEIQSILNKHASKGWELDSIIEGADAEIFIILKGKK